MPSLHASIVTRAASSVLLLLILLALLTCALLPATASAQERQVERQRVSKTSNAAAPTVAVTTDTAVLTRCSDDALRNLTQVQLRADTTGYTGGTMRYGWKTTGGRIVGDGATPVWDLSGVAPGTYTASIEVDNGIRECQAFSSTSVVVRDCAPRPVQCPRVKVLCPETVNAGESLTFVANVSGPATTTPVFTWTVSAGTITDGQGTSAITVDTTGIGGTSVTATVNLSGYDQTCDATATCTTPVVALPTPRRFDEFPSITFDDDKARFDNFAIELQNDPSARGFIVVYQGARSRPNQAARLGARARDYLVGTRGIDSSRITVVGGGTRPRDAFELYIVPRGANPPAVGR